MYVGGMSSSLPEDVQYAMYRTVAGLEHAVIVRNAYAIEYDCINPKELDPLWSSRSFRDSSAAASSMEAPGTRRQQPRDWWQASMRP